MNLATTTGMVGRLFSLRQIVGYPSPYLRLCPCWPSFWSRRKGESMFFMYSSF